MAEEYAEFHIEGAIKDDLLYEFLQLIRTFESKHTEDCHMSIEVKTNLSTRETVGLLRLHPMLEHIKIWSKMT